MPYLEPKKVKGGYILPKKEGGYHMSSSGKVVRFKSSERAKKAGRVIMAKEHGWKPKKKSLT